MKSSAINAPIDNEFELASIFSDRYGNDLRYTAAWGRWSIWNSQSWVKNDILYVPSLARTICEDAAANTGNRLRARGRSIGEDLSRPSRSSLEAGSAHR